ncbi:MAG: hypothetical protein H6918_00500 [Sphingomonadaceae bacterium]|nr:hypothetical protein [Sphingomonadaceae bacterium]
METLSIVATVLAILALLASLRLSLPPTADRFFARQPLTLLTSAAWLVPYIVVMGLAVGLMIKGQLSPWPQEAMADFAGRWGKWAGIAALLVVGTVDLWMVWTGAMAARRFAPVGSEAAFGRLQLLNVVFGAIFFLLVALFAA